MKTKVLLAQGNRKVFLTPWKESYRGAMKEVLAKVGAEAPLFDSSLPADFAGIVIETGIAHVAYTSLTPDEAALKVADWRAFNEAVKTAAGVQAEVAIKAIPVTVL